MVKEDEATFQALSLFNFNLRFDVGIAIFIKYYYFKNIFRFINYFILFHRYTIFYLLLLFKIY